MNIQPKCKLVSTIVHETSVNQHAWESGATPQSPLTATPDKNLLAANVMSRVSFACSKVIATCIKVIGYFG